MKPRTDELEELINLVRREVRGELRHRLNEVKGQDTLIGSFLWRKQLEQGPRLVADDLPPLLPEMY